MAEPRRDRWGRYIIPDPATGEDREWTRATTLAGVMPDRYHLERWGERMVVLGMGRDHSLPMLAKTAQYDDKDLLNKIARDAKSAAQSGQRANVGTAMHRYTELVDAGKDVDIVDAEYRDDVRAYQNALELLEAKIIATETIVVNPEVGIAGTFDRVLQTKVSDRPMIMDIKTGNTVHFGFLEYAVQLSVYANATHVFDEESGDVRPVPWDLDKQFGLIFHMKAGTGSCEVWSLDLVRGWEAAKLAVQVREARSWKDLGKKLDEEEA